MIRIFIVNIDLNSINLSVVMSLKKFMLGMKIFKRKIFNDHSIDYLKMSLFQKLFFSLNTYVNIVKLL